MLRSFIKAKEIPLIITNHDVPCALQAANFGRLIKNLTQPSWSGDLWKWDGAFDDGCGG